MEYKERKLSEYIDQLNREKKPRAHVKGEPAAELENLLETVRMVKSLKNPAMPDAGFPERLKRHVARRLDMKRPMKKRRAAVLSLSGIAAVVALVLLISMFFTTPNKNIVYAMEEAFRKVQAYHGKLEVVQSNELGESTVQAKLEVWADREGRYYVRHLDGFQEGMVTVNNGQRKWQVKPEEKQVHIFPAFPDAYRFSFELGREIEHVKAALTTSEAGEDTVAGRKAVILEVTPAGGEPYKIWVDKETKLPLKKEYAMQKALRYTITYTDIEFIDAVPAELTVYETPEGFAVIDKNPELVVDNGKEAVDILGVDMEIPETVPAGYSRDGFAVLPERETIKLYFTRQSTGKRMILLLKQSEEEFRVAPMAVTGSIGEAIAEIQSPVQEQPGVLSGGGMYQGITDTSSVRWQQDGLEFAVVGEEPLEDILAFVESITGSAVKLPVPDQDIIKPQIEVPVDMEVEKNSQKSVDSGSSPWLLDNVFVAQVFVSLKVMPEGITGEYPVKYEDMETIYNDGVNSIVEIHDENSPIAKVYLKRLVRQDNTGIWTVVGYDPRG